MHLQLSNRHWGLRLAIYIAPLLLILALLGWWLYPASKTFPALPVGVYLGQIENVFEDADSVPIYIEHTAGTSDLLVKVLRDGWQAQRIATVVDSAISGGQELLAPIVISAEESVLRLIGSQVGDGRFAGSVTDREGDTRGRWNITRVLSAENAAKSNSGGDDSYMAQWLSFYSDLRRVADSIGALEVSVPQQKAEIDKLTAFLGDDTKNKIRLDDKFTRAREEMATVAGENKQLKEQLFQLGRQLQVSLKVTSEGRLVSLARESLDREMRWIDAVGGAPNAAEIAPELQDKIDHAEKIISLKRQILEERRSTEDEDE